MKKPLTGSQIYCLVLSITLVVLLIVYAIVIADLYVKRKWIFEPYKPPTPPGSHFYPLGGVVPMTKEFKDQRANFINNAINSKN